MIRGRTIALLGTLALLCGGCLPSSGTAEGQNTLWLYQVAIGAAAVIFVIVWGWLTWNVVRYRVRDRRSAGSAAGGTLRLPPQEHGNTALEVLWTVGPLLTITGLFLATLGVLNAIGATSQGADPPSPPAGVVVINVTGFRWGWTFQYGDGLTITGTGIPGPQAVVPADEPVRFDVTAKDVIHSFYVPQFLAKYDAIPGRVNSFTVSIAPGAYGGECAEFCGLLHYSMPFSVLAMPRSDYDAWLTQQLAARAEPSP